MFVKRLPDDLRTKLEHEDLRSKPGTPNCGGTTIQLICIQQCQQDFIVSESLPTPDENIATTFHGMILIAIAIQKDRRMTSC